MRTHRAIAISLQSADVISKAVWVLAFACLTFIGAKIEIPTQPVPYTLQTFFVMLSGAFLGPYLGALSQFIYLTAGSVGIPVFAGPVAGIGKLFGPTGGYLLAFPISAFVIGYLIRLRKSFIWALFSMFLGLVIIFSLGTIWLNIVLIHNWKESLKSGFLIFSVWDAVKLFASASIYSAFRNLKK